MGDACRKEEFLRHDLVAQIVGGNDDLAGSEVMDCSLRRSTAMDGFMGTIYHLDVTVRRVNSGATTTVLKLLVKVMKGSESFRRESLGFILFPNEINVYKNIVPAFKQLITTSGAAITTGSWCPRVFFSEQGHFPAYSDQLETILVMQNVQPLGFVSGPRLDLDEAHLLLMARKIAQFHACSYAMRITDEPKLRQLVDAIIPLNFIQDGKVFFESYDIVFRHTQQRLFNYFDEHPELLVDDKVRSNIELLRKTYGGNPSKLMQRCLQKDDVYSVILHGDFNRNNVLFKYTDDGTPEDVLMIDFQENRFGTPALDLSFFMYMNIETELRERCWSKVLRCYHDELIRCLLEITKLPEDDVRLEPYRYINILKHLSQYFIYGAIIAVKFLPVMMASEEEVARVTHYFQNDVRNEAFRTILQSCGGEAASRRIAEVMLHCSRMGYLQFLRD
uniref:Putative juvenile hormone-inducible protein n=1 Tax=Culex tarsalis TaxID=7177 RepID=A0A1Q3FMK1_CULTA